MMTWFNDLANTIEEFKITLENMYNMDESGFSIGTIEASRVIINASVRQKFQAQPGCQEWVTSVECICADGTALDPLIIFRGENTSQHWLSANTPQHWHFSCNSKGWTSNIHGGEWLQRCFKLGTREKLAGKSSFS